MNKTQKTAAIAELKDKFENNKFFYVTDSSTLTVEEVNDLRRKCFEGNVEMQVVKNTLAIKALESANDSASYADLLEAFKGPTTILFSESANVPAKIIHEFRKSHDRPVLKAAFIESDIFHGDDQIDTLKALKSKEDLIGEVI